MNIESTKKRELIEQPKPSQAKESIKDQIKRLKAAQEKLTKDRLDSVDRLK